MNNPSECELPLTETQYTSYSFDTTTLVVLFLRSEILYSIRIVLKATINSITFEFAV